MATMTVNPGAWRPVDHALQRFEPSVREELRGKMEAVIARLIDHQTDVSPVLEHGLPNAVQILSAEELSVALDMAKRALDKGMADWALTFHLVSTILRSPSHDELTANQRNLESLVVQMKENSLTLYWALRSVLSYVAGRPQMLGAFFSDRPYVERLKENLRSPNSLPMPKWQRIPSDAGTAEEQRIIAECWNGKARTDGQAFQAIAQTLSPAQLTRTLPVLLRLVNHGILFYWMLTFVEPIAKQTPHAADFADALTRFETTVHAHVKQQGIDVWIALALTALGGITDKMTDSAFTVDPAVTTRMASQIEKTNYIVTELHREFGTGSPGVR